MQFSSIQQIQLALRVKKSSDSGLFKNERLLVIKSGFISYYSKIPKQFVGNTRSLQLIGQLPKYTLSAQFVISVTYNYPQLEIKFLKHKLIDRDGFQKMITSSNNDLNFNTAKTPTVETSVWHFKCKEVDLAKAFVEQVKICMKPEPQPEQQKLKEPSLQHRKSLQPSFKFVFDAFKQAKEQRQQKEIQQIINERASNYFSSSQINNQLKNRDSVLNFGFLKGRQTANNLQDKLVNQFKLNQPTLLKPIEMPKPYQGNVINEKVIVSKKQIISQIKSVEIDYVQRRQASQPFSMKQGYQSNVSQVDAGMLVEGKMESYQNQLQNDQIQQSQPEILANQLYVFPQHQNQTIQTFNQPTINQALLKSQTQTSNNQNQPKLIQSHQSQQLYKSSQPLQTPPQENQLSSQTDRKPYDQVQTQQLKPQNQVNSSISSNSQIQQDQDEQEDKNSAGKISSIYQPQDSQLYQPQLIARNQSKGSLVSLVKGLDPVSSFINQIKETQILEKSPQILQNTSQNYSSNETFLQDQLNPQKFNQPQDNKFIEKQPHEKTAFQQHRFDKSENPLQQLNLTEIQQKSIYHSKIKELKLKSGQKKIQSSEINKKPYKSSINQSMIKKRQSTVNKGQITSNLRSYAFGIKKEPQKAQSINKNFRRIGEQIEEYFKSNIDCIKEKFSKKSEIKHQKGKSNKNQLIFKKFQTVKQFTINFHQSLIQEPTSKGEFLSNTIPQLYQSEDHQKYLTQNQFQKESIDKEQNLYFKLIQKYQQSKQKKKSYSFIMYTDFTNYHSLLQQHTQENLNFDGLNRISPNKSDSMANFVCYNYASRLYSKFKCYQFFSSIKILSFIIQSLGDERNKLQLKIPMVFYMRYKQFQGLIIENNFTYQDINSKKIQSRHKIDKQEIWKKFSQHCQKNHLFTLEQKIIEKDILRIFLQQYDLFITDSVERNVPYWSLFIEQKRVKEVQISKNNSNKQVQNSKSSKNRTNITHNSKILHKNIKQQTLSPQYMFESVEVLNKIREICIQQLITGLQSNFANPINFQTAQKYVTIGLIQQVLQKIISNNHIQKLLNLQQQLQKELSQNQNLKRIQFVQNTVIFFLTQLFGFTITASKEIKYHIKTQSNYCHNPFSQNQNFNHKQKQPKNINYLINQTYLLSCNLTDRANNNSLEILEIFYQVIQQNNQVQTVFNILNQLQSDQQNLSITNQIKFKLFQKTSQIISEAQLAIQTVTGLERLWNQRQNLSKKNQQKNHLLVQNCVQRNLILVQFYSISIRTFELFCSKLINNKTLSSLNDNLTSCLFEYIQKCIFYTNGFVSFVQQNLNLIWKIHGNKQLSLLQQNLQKLIFAIMHSSQSLFHLKNLQINFLSLKDQKQVKQNLSQVIANSLKQVDFLQKLTMNLSEFPNYSKNITSKTKYENIIIRRTKIRLQILLIELKCWLNPRSLNSQDYNTINRLLVAASNQRDQTYIEKSLNILLVLWKQNVIIDEQIIEIFAHLCSIENLVQAWPQMKTTMSSFLTESVTIEQRHFYLKKFPLFDKFMAPKPNSSFQ